MTYICFRQIRESYTLAIFNDRSARAVYVHVDVVAFVHPELPAVDHDDTVPDARDVCWARNLAAEE